MLGQKVIRINHNTPQLRAGGASPGGNRCHGASNWGNWCPVSSPTRFKAVLEPPHAAWHTGLLNDAILGKGARQGCSSTTTLSGQPQLPYSWLPGPGNGVGFAQGGSSSEPQLRQGRAGIPWSAELPGRAGRAWRAGCDVKPGGGSVGPSAPIPGPAHAPVTARTITTLLPAPKPFSKACRVPSPAAPPCSQSSVSPGVEHR